MASRESLIAKLADIERALEAAKTDEERKELLALKRKLLAQLSSLPSDRAPQSAQPTTQHSAGAHNDKAAAVRSAPPENPAAKSSAKGSTASSRGAIPRRAVKKAAKPSPRRTHARPPAQTPRKEALESLTTTASPGEAAAAPPPHPPLPPRQGIHPPADLSASFPMSNPAASAPAAIPADLAPAPAPEIAPAALIRRTPHMDVDQAQPLKAGATFKVSVYVDQDAAHGGEGSEDVVVPAGANVDVHLVASDHFTISGPSTVTMEVSDAPRSDAPPFNVTVKAGGNLRTDVPPSLIALFFYQGRPSGKVSRAISIAGVAAPPPADADAAKPQLEAQAGISADLIVTITAAEINDGRQFFCTVTTPRFDKYKAATTRPWNLPGSAEDIVLSFMEQFTASGNSDAELTAGLRGAGRLLYDAAPEIFKDALWAMIDANQAPAQIALVTAEPFIPWELMIPYRKRPGQAAQYLAPQGPKALGVSFSIGRWPTEDGISPNQNIPLVDSYVIAPSYNPPLVNAQAEAAFVVENFAGEVISPANFAQIQRALGTKGRSLVHFVCHGKDQDTVIEAMRDDQKRTRARAQTIVLDDNKTLDSTQILGMEGLETVFEAKRPFVFLNACEIGRAIPALIGLGGFASSFIDLGASGVVAALWSVEDTIASEVAKSFYQRLKSEPNTPFAEILRDLRSKAYGPGAKDTYAAYCFYGDPAARRASAS